MAVITDIKRRILELSPAGFQEFCDAFLKKKGYGLIHSYGIQSGIENTTIGHPDTYFRKDNGKYVFVIYTKQQTNIYKKIKEDIDKCLDKNKTKLDKEDIDEIICCHSSSNLSSGDDQQLYKYCKEQGVKLMIYGIDEISLEVFNSYHSLVRDYLGLSIDTNQIMDRDDFIYKYNSNKMVAPLNTIFQFRNDEKIKLKQYILDSSIVMVTGKAGVGKTRLVLETILELESEKNYKVLCVKNNNLPIYDDLVCHLEEKEKYLLFLDDANEFTGLSQIISYITKEKRDDEIKIVVTVRDYVKKEVEKIIIKYEYPRVINVEVFNKKQITEFLKSNFNIDHEIFISQIMNISRGNLRMTYMAGKIATENNTLKSIIDVTQLYEVYYSPYVDIYFGNNEKLCFFTGFLAIVRGLCFENQYMYSDVLKAMDISIEEVRKYIEYLSTIEFVEVKKDKVVLFSDQSLANYMIYYTFFQRKICPFSTVLELCFPNFENSIIEAINVILNLFNNDNNIEHCTQEILKAWNIFSENKYFNDFVKVFHIFNPEETFIYINDILEELDFKIINNENSYIDYHWILDSLSGFENEEYFETVLDLLMKYCSKSNNYLEDGCIWLIRNYGLNRDALNGEYYNITFVSNYLFDHLKNEIHYLVFFKWVNKVLRLYFPLGKRNDKYSNYDGFMEYSDELIKYRFYCWKGLLKASKDNAYKRQIILFLNSYVDDFEVNVDIDTNVFEYDLKFIKKIINHLMTDDLLVMSCINKFQTICKLDCEEIWNSLLKSETWLVYDLLKDNYYQSNLEYFEYEKCRKNKIEKYVEKLTREDIKKFIITINDFMSLYSEELDMYGIDNGIEISIDCCINNKEKLFSFFENIILYGTSLDISPRNLFTFLYYFFEPIEIYNYIMKYDFNQKNKWQYVFFETLPQEYVTRKLYDELKKYFENVDNNKNNQFYNYNLKILDKFLIIEKDIYPIITKIIMNSKNNNLQKNYLTCLFEDDYYNYTELLELFSRNQKLLFDVYFSLLNNDKYLLCDNVFLLQFIEYDKNNLIRFSKLFWRKENKSLIFECDIIESLWKSQKYEEYFDRILEFMLEKELYVIEIFKHIFYKFEDSTITQRQETYLLKYIRKCNDVGKINYIFYYISELNYNLRKKAVLSLVDLNIDNQIIDKLPLMKGSYIGGDTLVPVYQKEKKFLESLLPYMRGIKFVRYKKRIKDLIELLLYDIEQEKIRNILDSL